MRLATEERTRSRMVNSARSMPTITMTEQQWSSRLVTKVWSKVTAASWDKDRETILS